jgi:hypothetical protein
LAGGGQRCHPNGVLKALLRQVFHSSKRSLVLLGHEPEMEMGHSLHQRQEADALDSWRSLDRRNEPMEKRAELDTFSRRHLTEVQQMPPGFDDDCACARGFQRSALDEEVLIFDDVAPWARRVQSSDPVFRPSCLRQILQSDRCNSKLRIATNHEEGDEC